MAKAVVQRSWPDGETLLVEITVRASWPDAVAEVRQAAVRAYEDALEVTLARDIPADDEANGD